MWSMWIQNCNLKQHKNTVHKKVNQETTEFAKEQRGPEETSTKCQLCEFEADTEDSLTGHLMS